MAENTNTKRKGKSNGIIGRTSDKEIKIRRSLCQEVFDNNPSITKDAFISVCKTMYHNNGIKVPTDQTIIKDAKECHINFKRGIAEASSDYTPFNKIGFDIGYYFRQIRVICKSYDIKLFDVNNFSESLTKTDFLSPLDKLRNTNKTHKKTISGTTLVEIVLILNKKGIEKYIEDTFDKHFSVSRDYLFTETHNYCVKIILEFKNLKKVMNKVYEIVIMINPSYSL